jgi:ribonuclease HII
VISAASIIAKVWRDRHMKQLQDQYPHFSFAQHKGYGTKRHREELKLHGATPEHRKSFKGVLL